MHETTPSQGRRHRAPTLLRRCFVRFAAALAVMWAVLTPGRVWAMPLDGASPTSAGLPGAELVRNLIGWGFWLGLAVCGLVIVYGAATWRGMNGNAGRGVEGKMYVAAGAIGAMVIGLAPTIVSTLFDAGQAG